jgi:PRC-barrel domain
VKTTLHSLTLAVAVVAAVVQMPGAAWAADVQATRPFTTTSPALESVLGKDVATLREGDGGRVIDLLIDRDGNVRAAVVEFGGFLGIGTRKIAVDWTAFQFAGKSILVDVTRDQLRAAAEYKTNEAPFVVQAASPE